MVSLKNVILKFGLFGGLKNDATVALLEDIRYLLFMSINTRLLYYIFLSQNLTSYHLKIYSLRVHECMKQGTSEKVDDLFLAVER